MDWLIRSIPSTDTIHGWLPIAQGHARERRGLQLVQSAAGCGLGRLLLLRVMQRRQKVAVFRRVKAGDVHGLGVEGHGVWLVEFLVLASLVVIEGHASSCAQVPVLNADV